MKRVERSVGRAVRLGVLAMVVLWGSVACSVGGHGVLDAAPNDQAVDAVGAVDANGADAGVDAGGAIAVTTPASHGAIALAFDVSIEGTVAVTGMTTSVSHNVGTLQIDGETAPIVVYEKIPWNTFNTTLYQAVALRADRWDVIWFYCSGTSLTTIDYEDTTGIPLVTLNASGTCMDVGDTVQTLVQAPASTLTLDSLVPGFTITGAHLTYDGMAPGTMTNAGETWSVYPFNLIDCSTGCGSPGWYELHSIYWNATQTCFGIFYLESAMPTSVPLEYTLCLPGVTSANTSFRAAWTHP